MLLQTILNSYKTARNIKIINTGNTGLPRINNVTKINNKSTVERSLNLKFLTFIKFLIFRFKLIIIPIFSYSFRIIYKHLSNKDLLKSGHKSGKKINSVYAKSQRRKFDNLFSPPVLINKSGSGMPALRVKSLKSSCFICLVLSFFLISY